MIKQILLFFPRYLVTLVLTFWQQARWDYYVGYILTCILPFAAPQIGFRIAERFRPGRHILNQ